MLVCRSPQTICGFLRGRINCMSVCWHLNGHLSRVGTLHQGGIAVGVADPVAGPAPTQGCKFLHRPQRPRLLPPSRWWTLILERAIRPWWQFSRSCIRRHSGRSAQLAIIQSSHRLPGIFPSALRNPPPADAKVPMDEHKGDDL